MNRSHPLFFPCILAFFLIGLFIVPLRAEDPHFPSSEDLRHVKAMGRALLSPDGTEVLFTVTDATADGAKSHLWITPVDGSRPARQMTYSPASDKRGERGASWAPDGSAIFFLAGRGEGVELYRLPMGGGEAMAYDLKVAPVVDDSKEKDAIPPAKSEEAETDSSKKSKNSSKPEPIAISVSGFAVSPDGHWLAVWAADPETPGEKKAKEAKADAVWVDHEHHGERLYVVGLRADGALDGELKPVAIAPDVHEAVWSPHSDRIAVVTEPPNGLSDLKPAAQAWLVKTAALDKPVQLAGFPPDARGGITWKPDGIEIAFDGQTPEDAPPGVSEVFALEVTSDGARAEARRLTKGFEGTVAGGALYLNNNPRLLVPAAKGTRLTAINVPLNGSGTVEFVPQATPVVTGLATNFRQTGWVWFAESSDQPPALCYAHDLGSECKTLKTPELTPKPLRAVKSELVHWQSDALTIEGLLYLPPDASKKKVPLIVDVHGGPLGAWEDRYQEWIGFLMGHGWAVLRPNVRGSSAYGVAFAAANKNDLGGGDFRDVMAGVDAVLKTYPIDPDKLVLMGYSYGGEMAGFAEGKTDRFKAIISGAPVIDQFSEYGTEEGSWYDRWYFGKPWEHFEDAWRQSPLSGAGKAKTPFLLLQGQSDSTDPQGQAQEMYRALLQSGVPVQLVTYPREDHGPLARGIFGYPVPEPWHGFDGRQRIVEFLDKELGTGKK
jgi:dipeptidyl aminopeptidase/acylaminoacyl peptidase